MPTIHMYLWRLPTLSPTSFRTHYETVHLPLVRSLAGEAFPTHHKRIYTARAAEPPHEAQTLPLPGRDPAQSKRFFDWDVVVEMSFETPEKMQEMLGAVMREDVAKKLREDEERFLDQGRAEVVIVEEV